MGNTHLHRLIRLCAQNWKTAVVQWLARLPVKQATEYCEDLSPVHMDRFAHVSIYLRIRKFAYECKLTHVYAFTHMNKLYSIAKLCLNIRKLCT